jgi:type IV secretion system protein VirB10
MLDVLSMTRSEIPAGLAKSPVFERNGKVHAGLVQPKSAWSLLLQIMAIAILGAATFLTLSSNRQAISQPLAQTAVRAPVETPPPVPRPIPEPVLPPRPAPPPLPVQAVTPLARWRAPAMVVDFSQPSAAAPAAPTAAAAIAIVSPPAAGGTETLSVEERFAARVSTSDVDTAHATKLHDVSRIAPQGTVIPGVLETAINSDLPGFVRAVVSRDVRGFDGTTVLVPRGSKLFGQYRSGVVLSQTRAFVVWSRILTPDGVSINIGSPATDRLGRGGLEGETDTHFFERFGGAILLSAITVGLDSLLDNRNRTAIFIGSSQQASQVAAIALQSQINIPVTVKVPQGTPMQVFVTRDLDFSGVAAAKP